MVALRQNNRAEGGICCESSVSFPGPEVFGRAGRRHMKFVVVNGRTPRQQTRCALCCEPIGKSYLRELTTRLSYCDHKCYAGNCKVAALALQKHARAS